MKRNNLFFILLATSTLFSSTLPDSFDLRDVDGKNYINPVKDQNPYGTCYSFMAAATAEGAYNYTLDLYDENRASFSETFLIWSLGQHYEGFPFFVDGSGAETTYDYMQAMVEYGMISDEILPYNTNVMNSYIADLKEKKLNYYWDEPRVKFAGTHRLPINDIETIKKAIYKFGTIGLNVYATNPWSLYTDGVFTDAYNESTEVLEEQSFVNHGVNIVGWTDNNAWILRNSWDDEWGKEGYMYTDFTSAGVSLTSTYLHYLPWNEYGFEDINIDNTTNITATSEDTGYQIVSRGIYEWGNDNSSINNEATILAEVNEEGFLYVHGIYLWAGDGSSIENSGIINANASSSTSQATAYGVLLQGTEFTNSGSINVEALSQSEQRATAYGIRHYSFDENSNLTNSGNIISKASSVNGWAYGVYGTYVELMENHGTITVEGGDSSVGMINDGQRYENSTIKNYGDIQVLGNKDAIGIYSFYTDVVNEKDITVSGKNSVGIYGDRLIYWDIILYEDISIDITNNGNIVVSAKDNAVGIYGEHNKIINTGTITTTSTNGEAIGLSLLGATGYNNGVINGNTYLDSNSFLGGTGIFNGDVINESGVVNPGNSIGVMTINGDYIQEAISKLSIELNSTNSDKLIVNGDVYVKDGGVLELVPLEYLTTTSYDTFIQSNDINGSFVLDAPAVLGANLNQTNGNLSLYVNRQTYASLGKTYSQAQVGQAIESLRPTASSDMQTIIDTFETLRLNDFQKALSELTPNFYTSTAYATQETQTLLNVNLNTHFQDLKNLNDKQTHTWGTLLYSTSRVKSQKDILGFNQSSSGVMLGFDKKIQNNLTLGIAISIIDQDINERGSNGESDIDSYYAHLYAKYDLDNWFFTSSISYGNIDTKSTRDIRAFQREAKSKYSSQSYAFNSQVGYDFKFDQYTLTPILELSYNSLHVNSFNENGAGDVTLHVNKQQRDSLQSNFGLKLSHIKKQDNKYVKPSLHVKWIHEHLNDNDTLQSNFIQSGLSLKTTPRKAYDNRVVLGGGLELGFIKNLTMSINANSIFTTNSNSEYEVGAKLKFVF